MRLVIDIRSIEKTPFIGRPETQLCGFAAAAFLWLDQT
jgi:hypothetical protein